MPGGFEIFVQHLAFFPEVQQLVVAEDFELIFQGEGILLRKKSCYV